MKVGFIEKVVSERRFGGGARMHHVTVSGNSIPGRGMTRTRDLWWWNGRRPLPLEQSQCGQQQKV